MHTGCLGCCLVKLVGLNWNCWLVCCLPARSHWMADTGDRVDHPENSEWSRCKKGWCSLGCAFELGHHVWRYAGCCVLHHWMYVAFTCCIHFPAEVWHWPKPSRYSPFVLPPHFWPFCTSPNLLVLQSSAALSQPVLEGCDDWFQHCCFKSWSPPAIHIPWLCSRGRSLGFWCTAKCTRGTCWMARHGHTDSGFHLAPVLHDLLVAGFYTARKGSAQPHVLAETRVWFRHNKYRAIFCPPVDSYLRGCLLLCCQGTAGFGCLHWNGKGGRDSKPLRVSDLFVGSKWWYQWW